MGKNKNVTVFLLIAVLTIWGSLAFRIYNTLAGTSNYKPAIKMPKATQVSDEDNFELHEYARDPFLSILTDTATKEIIEPIQVVKNTPPPKPLNLPQYCGIVGSQGDKDKIAILRVNKKHIFIKEGEKYDSMNVISIKEDQLILNNKGNKIILPINNTMVSFK